MIEYMLAPMSNMKIGFVSSMNSVPWGGSEILWYEAAEQLAAAGHRLVLCTPAWPEIPTPIQIARDKWGAEHTFDCSSQPRPWSERISSRLFKGFTPFHYHWLRRAKPEILCISNGNAFQGLAWMEAAIAEGIPFVTIAQAHAEFISPGEFEAQRLIRAFSAARVNYFVSRANQSLVEHQLGYLIDNARLIANHSRYIPISAPLPWPQCENGLIRLACVGRLHPSSKGQDLLFDVLADPSFRGRDLQVSLYGVGEQEHVLRRLAENLNLSDRVQFRGHTSNSMEIWQTHHALVLPSRYEGMPLVVMEAMLAGRPVITTAVAGASELLEHGITGFLAEAATTMHLKRCLDEAWHRREHWASIGNCAYEVASARARRPAADLLASDLLELMSS